MPGTGRLEPVQRRGTSLSEQRDGETADRQECGHPGDARMSVAPSAMRRKNSSARTGAASVAGFRAMRSLPREAVEQGGADHLFEGRRICWLTAAGVTWSSLAAALKALSRAAALEGLQGFQGRKGRHQLSLSGVSPCVICQGQKTSFASESIR